MPAPEHNNQTTLTGSVLSAVITVLVGLVGYALAVQSVLQEQQIAQNFYSTGLWLQIVTGLGGSFSTAVDGSVAAEVGFLTILGLAALNMAVVLPLFAWLISRRTKNSFPQAACLFAQSGWAWWWIPGIWEVLRIATLLAGLESSATFLTGSVQFWFAITWAGWLATGLSLAASDASPEPQSLNNFRIPKTVWFIIGLFVLVFFTMNLQLWRGLLIPHGDSAMYEEHLWNLTHGKGFRSYLDQGLFLGEHIQVSHLLLLPVYFIWPSHLLLELAESTALAAGAIPIFWMAQRHTGSARAALLLAIAYLFYFPLHFLDIAIELKTFRPICFGVPALLFALDQLERGRWKSMAVLLAVTLSAKEDFAIVLAPLGVWIACRHFLTFKPSTENQTVTKKQIFVYGMALAVCATVYLVVVTRVIIPWFRSGDEVHYARYFEKFGTSLTGIAWNMLTNPSLLFQEFVTNQSAFYLLAMLAPLAFVPLFSPGRLLVAAPLFGILCLNQLAQDPRHHFHAPLVPIVFWAAAAGLGSAGTVWQKFSSRFIVFRKLIPNFRPHSLFFAKLCCLSAVATGMFFSLSPAGIVFWDSHSAWSWQKLYVPGPRAEQFAKIEALIPKSSNVASTDFVHPRFTHHRRSYDYSNYARKVSGYELQVPADTDYIVIDTQHRYSEIKTANELREYREHPEKWELLLDETDGYFIVLKRRR